MDPRRGSNLGRPDEQTEITYLRAGRDPPWERPHRDGVDITEQPELWTPYQRQRREAFEARAAEYQRRGLIRSEAHGEETGPLPRPEGHE